MKITLVRNLFLLLITLFFSAQSSQLKFPYQALREISKGTLQSPAPTTINLSSERQRCKEVKKGAIAGCSLFFCVLFFATYFLIGAKDPSVSCSDASIAKFGSCTNIKLSCVPATEKTKKDLKKTFGNFSMIPSAPEKCESGCRLNSSYIEDIKKSCQKPSSTTKIIAAIDKTDKHWRLKMIKAKNHH